MKSKSEIEQYLKDAKESIEKGHYVIQKREKNDALESKFVINSSKKKQILLSLQTENFSHTLNNEHEKYKDEILYVFGKDVELANRIGEGQTNVSLYIKFNKLANQYVYVVSLHEQEHRLDFPFK